MQPDYDSLFPDLRPAIPVTDSDFAVIAGPCSAESRRQTLDTAFRLSRLGVRIFRAGAWKPRTHPGVFEGRGVEALDWLREVKEKTSMLVATEVATPSHVEAALAAGIDILWIGARTSTNPFAVDEIAHALSGTDTPVIVKNPANPDLELWIGAIQRLYNVGLRRLSAVHRGFSAYGPHPFRNPPFWEIPLELRRRIPSLQLLCDPSHIAGQASLVPSVARQAVNLRFSGLIIESHLNPSSALSDASQQLTPDEVAALLSSLQFPDSSSAETELHDLRAQIDILDSRLLSILAQRMQVVDEIGQLKQSHNMAVFQSERYGHLLSSRIAEASSLGLDSDFVARILKDIHSEAIRRQLS